MHIEHTRLLVNNFGACFRFYQQVMGLKVTWGSETDSYASFTDREDQQVSLALFKRRAMANALDSAHLPPDAPCQDRFALIVRVADVDAAYRQFVARGTSFVVAPQSFPDWGIRSAYLRDPDGNLIELFSDLDPEEWSEGLAAASRRYAHE